MLATRTIPYGREASRALRDEIAVAQRDDALAPVTVVVPRNSIGLATRRLLASGDLGTSEARGRPGVINVRFTTLTRLYGRADRLGRNRGVREAARHSCSGARRRPFHALVDLPVSIPQGQGPPGDHPRIGRRLSRPHRSISCIASPAGGLGSPSFGGRGAGR